MLVICKNDPAACAVTQDVQVKVPPVLSGSIRNDAGVPSSILRCGMHQAQTPPTYNKSLSVQYSEHKYFQPNKENCLKSYKFLLVNPRPPQP